MKNKSYCATVYKWEIYESYDGCEENRYEVKSFIGATYEMVENACKKYISNSRDKRGYEYDICEAEYLFERLDQK